MTTTVNAENGSSNSSSTPASTGRGVSPTIQAGSDGLYFLFVVPPNSKCDSTTLETAANGEEGFFPVFLSESSDLSLASTKYTEGLECLMMEYTRGSPKLCGLKSPMKNVTAISRNSLLQGIYNFPFNNNRTLSPNKFRTCRTDPETRRTMQTSKLFSLNDTYTFSKESYATSEIQQVGIVEIMRNNSNSRGLIFIETISMTANEDDYVSYQGTLIPNYKRLCKVWR